MADILGTQGITPGICLPPDQEEKEVHVLSEGTLDIYKKKSILLLAYSEVSPASEAQDDGNVQAN